MKFLIPIAVFVALCIGVSEQKCSPEFEKAFLAKHNEYRDEHGVGPLVLNASISAFAQSIADHISALKHVDVHAQHQSKYGENVYLSNGTLSGAVPVEAWYSQVRYYQSFGAEPPVGIEAPLPIYQFTQVVWKATSQVGVGCQSFGTHQLVVANYDPHGNVPGHYKENVFAAVK